uniref:Na_H_Exchanger domain-containing protein n=1 Tax=Elaeophora elaphi TaxID=1147741 RepID=A0A0R3S0L2_9BILA
MLKSLQVFLFPFLALVTGLVLDATNRRIRFLRIPDTILIFLFALGTRFFFQIFIEKSGFMSRLIIIHLCLMILVIFFCYFILHLFFPQNLMAHIDETYTWKTVEPGIVVGVLLPLLIFESAVKSNSHLFFRKQWLLFALTATVYLLTLILYTALMLPFLRIMDNWNIFTVMLMGAILAATDPVAVVAILEDIGAPQRLKILIEGESLLNDGLAIFVYQILLNFVLKEVNLPSYPYTLVQYAAMCVSCIIISPLLGYTSAHITVMIIRHGISEEKRIQMFLVISVYFVWQLGEITKGSAAVATVFYGVTLNYLRERLNPRSVELTLQIWTAFGYWANCIVFMFSGYAIGLLLFNNPVEIDVIYHLISGVLLFPISLVARMLALIVFRQFWNALGSSHIVYDTDYVLLAYGGLKGALALLLVHEFTETVQHDMYARRIGEKVVLYASSAVFVCLSIQGMTFSYVTNREGTNRRSRYIKDSEKNVERHLNRTLRANIAAMRRHADSYLTEANWTVVNEQIEANVFKGFASNVGQYSRVQTSMYDESLKSIDSQSVDESLLMRKEDSDVCTGYYSILLARVYSLWTLGAISGRAAHLVIDLLEHGVDEGKLTLDDFCEHLNSADNKWYHHIELKILTVLRCWIDTDTKLNRLNWMGVPFLPYPVPTNISVLKPVRSLEWHVFNDQKINYRHFVIFFSFPLKLRITLSVIEWCIFSAFLAIIQSILIAFVMFWHPAVGTDVSYSVLMFTFLIAFIFFVEEVVHFHRLRKPAYRLELDRLDMRCFQSINRITIEFILFLVYISLIIGICIVLSIILAKYPNGSCIQDNGQWRHLYVCNTMRFVLLLFVVFLTLLKILRITPLFIFSLHETLYTGGLLRIRIQLSALYFLQFLLSQPPAKFTFFPGDSYHVALGEQKHLNKIVDALIRKAMKKNKEVLDLITVIKTKQAIRMAAQTLEHTIIDLQKQGFLHHQSMQQWERSLNRLRDRGERLINSPDLSYQDALESVHWIQAIDNQKRQDLVDKLVKYLETQAGIERPSGRLVQTFGKTMYFLRKGICKVTEMTLSRRGKEHKHDYYVYQGRFVGERNLLDKNDFRRESVKKPKVEYRTSTDCILIKIDEDIMDIVRSFDSSIIRTISRKEQTRRLIYELKEQHESFALITLDEFEKLYTRRGYSVGNRIDIEVGVGRKLIIGFRAMIVALKPSTSLDDHYHILGPAVVTLKPVGEDEGMLVLIDNERNADQPTLDVESNISLETETEEPDKILSRKKTTLPVLLEKAKSTLGELEKAKTEAKRLRPISEQTQVTVTRKTEVKPITQTSSLDTTAMKTLETQSEKDDGNQEKSLPTFSKLRKKEHPIQQRLETQRTQDEKSTSRTQAKWALIRKEKS